MSDVALTGLILMNGGLAWILYEHRQALDRIESEVNGGA